MPEGVGSRLLSGIEAAHGPGTHDFAAVGADLFVHGFEAVGDRDLADAAAFDDGLAGEFFVAGDLAVAVGFGGQAAAVVALGLGGAVLVLDKDGPSVGIDFGNDLPGKFDSCLQV